LKKSIFYNFARSKGLLKKDMKKIGTNKSYNEESK